MCVFYVVRRLMSEAVADKLAWESYMQNILWLHLQPQKLVTYVHASPHIFVLQSACCGTYAGTSPVQHHEGWLGGTEQRFDM